MRLRPFGELGHSRSSPRHGPFFPQKESMPGDKVIDSKEMPGLALGAAVIVSTVHSASRLLDSAVRLKPLGISNAVLQASSTSYQFAFSTSSTRGFGLLCILQSGAISQLVLFGVLMQRFIETHEN